MSPQPLHRRYHYPRCRQRGIASVAAVIFLLVAVMLALSQTISITASNTTDTNLQDQSVKALLAAESGVERAIGILNAQVITAAITNATCTTDVGPTGTSFAFPAGSTTSSFSYTTLTPTPSTCSGAACTDCFIQVVGKSGNTSRTINVNITTTGASGGATGCGGFDTSCDGKADINQYITATTLPTILLSNLSFRRHPGGGGNISATGCVVVSGVITVNCITQWTDESSSGSKAVGSRGASVLISAAGTYTLTQHLSSNSSYAASGGRVGQLTPSNPLRIVGSYWAESGVGSTVANSSATTGATNNGAAYPAIPPGPAATTPAIGTFQSSESWCYGGDTLIFGFSARSSSGANGSMTSFSFGNAPTSRGLHMSNAFLQHPTPVTGVTNSDVYSDFWFIYNPDYLSSAGAAASSTVSLRGSIGTTATGSAIGAVGTGSIGASFTGVRVSSALNTRLIVTRISGGIISVGDQIVCSGSGGCPLSGTPTIKSQLSGTTGGNGTYIVSTAISGGSQTMQARSTILNLTAVSSGLFPVNSSISGTGVTAGTTISSLGTGSGGTGTYNLNTTQTVSTTTITAQNRVLTITDVIAGSFSAGDVISGTGVTGSPIIQAFGTSGTTGTGGVGTYALSIAQNFTSTTISSPSSVLTVTALPGGGHIAASDVIAGSGISGSPGVNAYGSGGSTGVGGTGTYQLNISTQYAAPGAALTIALTPGTLVRVPVGTTVPTLNASYPMLVTRRAYDRATATTVGSGVIAAGTTVATVGANSFTLSAAPTTALSGATVCGGTCALFDHSTATSTTAFSLGLSNTSQWASGMTCYAGADPTTIHGLTGTGASTRTTTWHAPVF